MRSARVLICVLLLGLAPRTIPADVTGEGASVRVGTGGEGGEFAYVRDTGISVFTDRAAWEAAAGTSSTESFDGLTNFDLVSGVNSAGLIDLEVVGPVTGQRITDEDILDVDGLAPASAERPNSTRRLAVQCAPAGGGRVQSRTPKNPRDT